ncbi:maleylpyruvate isomerase N-terminal domain-containing protein [Nocardia sp. BSTN01]|uniref:maleylpyruvate isomerase N-terminal domain-containing protein n=1 Tax=Nocardia sp. BSTN01 TaxID=2783665 RepID=UPI00188ED066|nr:maleylpyruvate isomerase N-terminal domain-containing protein [Nocardia sp. BSTN01]MBF4995660.1 maleylpyruvate isomerase N-terminal domain-containing protein [Nocardia sp. BSTN01]
MSVDVLQAVWHAWARRTTALTAAQWRTPTRLPGWAVQDLVAHAAPDQGVLEFLHGPSVPDPEVTTGAEMIRRLHAPAGATHTLADDIAEQARRAAQVGPESLAAHFARTGPRVIAELRAHDRTTGLAYPHLGSASYGAIAETATVEATVHYLDLIAAVGGPPPPDIALRATASTLSAVADPVGFIEAATGRSTVAVFPVMR